MRRPADQRYQEDPAFQLLVQTLYHACVHGDYTPTEIREAAMLAQAMYEERHVRPLLIAAVQTGRVEP